MNLVMAHLLKVLHLSLSFFFFFFFPTLLATADLKILATGVLPNSESLHQFLGPALSPAGYVKVRPTLQLEGFGNIFAFGDIADLDHPKVIYLNIYFLHPRPLLSSTFTLYPPLPSLLSSLYFSRFYFSHSPRFYFLFLLLSFLLSTTYHHNTMNRWQQILKVKYKL
jgi:hypothetical protein